MPMIKPWKCRGRICAEVNFKLKSKTNLHCSHTCNQFQDYMDEKNFLMNRFLMTVNSDMCHASYKCHQGR